MKAYGFGNNGSGQLGLGHTNNVYTITPLTAWGDVSKVSALGSYSLFIDNNGTLKGCGDNSKGQLGIGSFTSPITSPTNCKFDDGTWIVSDISCGYAHTYVTKQADGSIYRTGDNSNKQCGRETISSNLSTYTSNQYALPMTQVKKYVSGFNFSIFLRYDELTYVIGNSSYGQLGSVTNNMTSGVLTSVYGSNIKEIISGNGYHVLVINNNGNLYSIGANESGQLGIGGTINKNTIQLVNLPSTVQSACCGRQHSVALLSNGDLYGVGKLESFGVGGTFGSSSFVTTPVKIDAPSGITKIVAHSFSTALITNKGELFFAGRSYKTNSTPAGFLPYFTKIDFPHFIEDIAVGNGHTIILTNEVPLVTKRKNNQAIWF